MITFALKLRHTLSMDSYSLIYWIAFVFQPGLGIYLWGAWQWIGNIFGYQVTVCLAIWTRVPAPSVVWDTGCKCHQWTLSTLPTLSMTVLFSLLITIFEDNLCRVCRTMTGKLPMMLLVCSIIDGLVLKNALRWWRPEKIL